MSDKSHVLRFPRSDEEGSFILAEVTPTGSGSKPLNLKIVATEGAAPYVISLRHDRVDKLKVKNCPCSQDEWEHILASVLLDGEPVEDIEAAASVQEEESVTITFRKRISGITQRLGALTLTHKEDEAIELYDWCGAAITSRSQIKLDLAKANARATELESAVNDLRGQLEELVAAKEDHESVLFGKFRDLLNEKKVKIREQQRILASANPNASFTRPARSNTPEVKEEKESQTTPIKAAPKSTRGGKAVKPARASKRKAKAAEPSDDDDSDDGFEKMDVDPDPKAQEDQLEEDVETTDAESRTESEPDDDDDDDAEPIPPPKAGSSRAGKDAEPSHSSNKSKSDEAPPPRRTLPFGNGKPPAKKAEPAKPAPAAAGGSDTDSDDEL